MPIKEHVYDASAQSESKNIKIYPEITFQRLSGIGGCFNEIGGEALAALSASDQKRVLKALFTLDEGAGFDLCRMSIGSSDFGIDAYSFSPVADDYNMDHFSMKREKEYMMPYIKQANKLNPNLVIFGSPWSPPAWMKESGYMDRGVEFPADNILKDDPKVYEAYALYFAKYVEAYQKEGINVDRIIIQNEQDVDTKYPSCRVSVEQMAKFVQEYLAPTFEKRSVDAQIWAGTFRTAGELDGVKFASNPQFMECFDGIGIQYTTADYISDIKSLAPDMPLMHTEGACFGGKNSESEAATRFAEVARYINGGSENFCYWNMILNETGKSGWDWRQNALITIDREAKSVTYNPDFAVISLMSRFIRPGSVRVAAFSRDTIIAVERQGGYNLILQNDSDKAYNIDIDIDGKIVKAQIPARSLAAIEVEQ